MNTLIPVLWKYLIYFATGAADVVLGDKYDWAASKWTSESGTCLDVWSRAADDHTYWPTSGQWR